MTEPQEELYYKQINVIIKIENTYTRDTGDRNDKWDITGGLDL